MGARRVGETRAVYLARHAREQKAWCKRHPGVNSKIARKSRMLHPERNLFRLAKRRAKEENILFDLEEKDIVIPKFCPALGIELVLGSGHVRDNAPSLDRIIPSKGYVRGNIWVISFRANRLKSDASLDELRKLVFNLSLKWPDKDQGSQS